MSESLPEHYREFKSSLTRAQNLKGTEVGAETQKMVGELYGKNYGIS